jgi:hypothetical protein
MDRKNKLKLTYIIFGWILAGYPIYLLLSFARIFLSQTLVVGLGIFIFVAATGAFIGGAEKKLREEKIDTILDKKLEREK